MRVLAVIDKYIYADDKYNSSSPANEETSTISFSYPLTTGVLFLEYYFCVYCNTTTEGMAKLVENQYTSGGLRHFLGTSGTLANRTYDSGRMKATVSVNSNSVILYVYNDETCSYSPYPYSVAGFRGVVYEVNT